jgi:hypothetical protein
MMVGNLVLYSQPPIPKEVTLEYFNAVSKNAKFHVCVITLDGGTPQFYIEKPHGNDENIYSGIIRTFFRIVDVQEYALTIAAEEELDRDSIHRLSLTVKDLIAHIKRLDARHRKNGNKGIKAVATMIDDIDICDVDVFWTSEPDFMV